MLKLPPVFDSLLSWASKHGVAVELIHSVLSKKAIPSDAASFFDMLILQANRTTDDRSALSLELPDTYKSFVVIVNEIFEKLKKEHRALSIEDVLTCQAAFSELYKHQVNGLGPNFLTAEYAAKVKDLTDGYKEYLTVDATTGTSLLTKAALNLPSRKQPKLKASAVSVGKASF